MNLLLLSSSRVHGSEFLQYAAEAIKSHFEDKTVLFIPYALKDHHAYEQIVADAFGKFNVNIESIHKKANPTDAIKGAEGLFIGGGNTFRLLNHLYEKNLIGVIRERVFGGMPYMGSSAGTNMACPTIRTSNDMPIKQPPSFDALNFIPFQINPHYLDAYPNSTHKGETRAQRLEEFLEENDVPVLGLREGSWLKINGVECTLRGTRGAILFQRGRMTEEKVDGEKLAELMKTVPKFDS